MPPDRMGDGLPHRKPVNKLAATTRTSSPDILAAPNMGRRYWARRMIDKAKGAPLPVYGSAEWLSLPDGDAVKVASVVVAAEAWAMDSDDIPSRLAVEVDAARVAHKQAEDAEYAERAKAHRETAPKPARSFMARRAQQLAEAQPRDTDYRGRSAHE
jgi:hypothetical protein